MRYEAGEEGELGYESYQMTSFNSTSEGQSEKDFTEMFIVTC